MPTFSEYNIEWKLWKDKGESNSSPVQPSTLSMGPCQFLPAGEPQGQAWGWEPVNTIWCWAGHRRHSRRALGEEQQRSWVALSDRPRRNEMNTDKPTWVEDAGSRPIWIGLKAPQITVPNSPDWQLPRQNWHLIIYNLPNKIDWNCDVFKVISSTSN